MDTKKNKTNNINNFHQKLAVMAVKAMDMEVSATPKPGLVDLDNNGSHMDMNHRLFLKSSASLYEFFLNIADIAVTIDNPVILPHLRNIGIEAEKKMLSVTDGINTHKGLIFSMGLFVAIISNHSYRNENHIDQNNFTEIRNQIILNTLNLVEELKNDTGSHGHSVYKTHGAEGIRREASLGYPAVFLTGYPAIKKYNKYFSLNTALVLTLMELMMVTEDTNIIYRGGLKALYKVRDKANEIIKLTDTFLTEGFDDPILIESEILANVRKMDNELISENISPGGTADNLALSIFLALLAEEISDECSF